MTFVRTVTSVKTAMLFQLMNEIYYMVASIEISTDANNIDLHFDD